MSRIRSIAMAACLAGILHTTPSAAADVGVSVSVGQPGFYGRIDIGTFPAPPVIYPQPVVVAPAPIAVVQQPIYLRVPPGHVRNWSKHCARYNACGQRTYFVQDDWYHDVYAPAYVHAHPAPHRHAGARHGGRDHAHHRRGQGHSAHRDHGKRGRGHDRD